MYNHVAYIQGYNNWTPGLYGYSWDMMVNGYNAARHDWVLVRNKDTGETLYLSPEVMVHYVHAHV